MPIAPDLYTTAEAAEMLGISRTTIRYAISRGTLAAVRIDARTNAITGAEIERYRTEHLGRVFGHDPNRPPTKGAEYARAYRERKKLKQQAPEPPPQKGD